MVFSGFDTTAFSATATAKRNWRAAVNCWVWRPVNRRSQRAARIIETAVKHSPALRCGNVRSAIRAEWRYAIARVAARAPATVGWNCTVMSQLALAARVAPHVFAEMENSAAFGPVMAADAAAKVSSVAW